MDSADPSQSMHDTISILRSLLWMCRTTMHHSTAVLLPASLLLQSYSPYTHCPSGVALLLEDGRVLAGGYIENAAHNPGLPPFQAAIVAAVVARVPSYSQVGVPGDSGLCNPSRLHRHGTIRPPPDACTHLE
jgi:hypothetical protein